MSAVSRRRVLTAGAWTIPVLSVSAALPAHAAASRTDRVTLTSSRAAAYPDETATVRVTSIDADGRPRAGDAVSLSLDDPARAIIERPTGVTDSSGAYTTSVRVRTDAAPGSLGITASTSSGATSTALEVREATVIRHDETGASTRVLAINVGSMEGRLLAILQSSDATQEALTRTVPVTVTSALGFVGIYDVRSGWIGMSRDGKRLVVTSTGVAPHDYSFTGKLYYQVALQNARGRTLVTVTVNGDDTHDKVVTALDGMSVSNGYRLLVTAAEPSRVRVYADSVQTGSLSMTPQTLTIRGGRFVV